jgi:hypothetical protein
VRVVSERIKDELVEKAGVTIPVSVLPIYVDTVRYADLARTKHPRFMVSLVCIGRLEKEKNFTLAIDALKRVRDAKYDAASRSSAVAPARGACRVCRVARGRQWVEGRMAQTSLVLIACRLVLVPSLYEGYGMVIIEALSAKMVFDHVASRVGAIVTCGDLNSVLRWIQRVRAKPPNRLSVRVSRVCTKYCADISHVLEKRFRSRTLSRVERSDPSSATWLPYVCQTTFCRSHGHPQYRGRWEEAAVG